MSERVVLILDQKKDKMGILIPNLYADPDRFCKEAFIKIPGVFNIASSEAEAALRGQGKIEIDVVEEVEDKKAA